MTSISYGSKYNKNLSVKDISSKIRSFIGKKKKDGTIPKEMKFSVKTRHHTSININITSVPQNMVIFDPKTCLKKRGYPIHCKKFNPKLQKIVNMIEKETQSYNYDGSDIQTDYFNVNFYDGRPDLDYRLRDYATNQIKRCIDEKGVYQPSLCKPIIEKIESQPSSPPVSVSSLTKKPTPQQKQERREALKIQRMLL